MFRSLRCRIGSRGPVVALIAIVAAFAALATTVAVKTPAWESADEPGHVVNVETLVAGHWYRIPTRELASFQRTRGFSTELHQPPLYYLLLAGLQRVSGRPARPVAPGPVSYPYISHGLYLHHRAADHRFLLLLRLPNVLLGMLTICLTFLTARALTGDRWTPVVAAAIVAFMPRFVFLSAFVTNDNLVDVLGAALAYCSVLCVRKDKRRYAIAVGGILGLLTVTKFSALPVLAVLVPILWTTRGSIRRLETLGLIAGTALIVCGWYLVQNDLRYGDPFALAVSQRYLQAIGGLGTFGVPYVVHDPLHLIFVQVPEQIWQTFWYRSGWNQFSWRGIVSLPFWCVLAFALVGVRARETSRGATPAPRRIHAITTLAVLTLASFISVWIVAFQTATYEARLALIGLPSLAVLAALGLERWKLPIRFLLPSMGLIGTLIAIEQNVLAVGWPR